MFTKCNSGPPTCTCTSDHTINHVFAILCYMINCIVLLENMWFFSTSDIHTCTVIVILGQEEMVLLGLTCIYTVPLQTALHTCNSFSSETHNFLCAATFNFS